MDEFDPDQERQSEYGVLNCPRSTACIVRPRESASLALFRGCACGLRKVPAGAVGTTVVPGTSRRTLYCIGVFCYIDIRSDRHSMLRRPFANRWLNIAIF